MADIFINYGSSPKEMTIALMQQANIAAQLHPSMKVCLKPNLVVARPASGGATTHPEIVEGVIVYLQSHGIKNITIAEGSWVGDSTKRAWELCGYRTLAQSYGVRLLDTKSDETVRVMSQGLALTLCKSAVQADYLINLPVLKGHCQTGMTCCLKNLKGVIPDSEKRRFHTMGLHKPIAALAAAIQPDLHIVDSICGDLSFEEGGNPIEANRILLGFDPVLLDSYGAGLLGFRPEEIEYLLYAEAYGVGRFCTESTEILELNAQHRPPVQPSSSRTAQRLAAFTDQDSACSACYAALIFALDKSGYRGEPVHIGQGFRERSILGPGVGNCCSGCTSYAKGCPPRAVDILDFLTSL